VETKKVYDLEDEGSDGQETDDDNSSIDEKPQSAKRARHSKSNNKGICRQYLSCYHLIPGHRILHHRLPMRTPFPSN